MNENKGLMLLKWDFQGRRLPKQVARWNPVMILLRQIERSEIFKLTYRDSHGRRSMRMSSPYSFSKAALNTRTAHFTLSYKPTLVTLFPGDGRDFVVMVILRPSGETTRRLVAINCVPLIYDATTVRESIRFSDTGSRNPRSPMTAACLPL